MNGTHLQPNQAAPQLVICGTDTDVGKTVVSALVVQGLGASYWKPVQSGLEGGGDSGRLQALLQLPAERLLPEAYRLRAPVSPHWAAEQEGIALDRARLALPAVSGPLVVETAGGLLVPLRRDWLQIDQLAVWGLPVLLVARSGLGTLNHTLLSVEALRRRCRALGGQLTLLEQPASAGLPAWEDAPSRPLIEAVKRQFDPLQQLARGRLPGVQAR